MTQAQSAFAMWLSRKAGWFVALSWPVFLLAAWLAFGLLMGPGLWADYHRQHEDIPLITGQITFAFAAAIVGFFVALTSSAAISNGERVLASASVLLCWISLLVGGTLYLNLIPRGPQYYDKYAGDRLFRVPWQYYPHDGENPSRSGFHISLCLDSLRGTYDKSCHQAQSVTILPGENGFDTWEERIWQWEHRRYKMPPIGKRNGFQIFPEGYYRRIDAEGHLNCLVMCRKGSCRRQALVGQLVVDYVLPEGTFAEWSISRQEPAEENLPDWDGTDRKLATLVNGWAIR
jgi:hypothetical protein